MGKIKEANNFLHHWDKKNSINLYNYAKRSPVPRGKVLGVLFATKKNMVSSRSKIKGVVLHPHL